MNSNEILKYIKENDLDACPECGNDKGNLITLPSENEKEGCITCAECRISWWPMTGDEEG